MVGPIRDEQMWEFTTDTISKCFISARYGTDKIKMVRTKPNEESGNLLICLHVSHQFLKNFQIIEYRN